MTREAQFPFLATLFSEKAPVFMPLLPIELSLQAHM
jgi:hypothetical protein